MRFTMSASPSEAAFSSDASSAEIPELASFAGIIGSLVTNGMACAKARAASTRPNTISMDLFFEKQKCSFD